MREWEFEYRQYHDGHKTKEAIFFNNDRRSQLVYSDDAKIKAIIKQFQSFYEQQFIDKPKEKLKKKRQ